jgi:DNA polymerase-3 subunit alpha
VLNRRNRNFYIIIDYQTFSDKTKPYVILRQVNSGEQFKTKVKDPKLFIENPFKLFDVLKVIEFKTQKKMKMINGKWERSNVDEQILTMWEVY